MKKVLMLMSAISLSLSACGYLLYYPRAIVAEGYKELDKLQIKIEKERAKFFESIEGDLHLFECTTCEVSRCLSRLRDDLGFCATAEIATAHCIDHATAYCKNLDALILCKEKQ